MAEGFIDIIRDGIHLSISDYIKAYDDDVAFEEVSYIDTSLITSIPTDNFFRKFKNLKYIRLPNVTDLPSYAFSGCSKLEKAVFPKVSILSNTGIFSGCVNLSQIQFFNNLKIMSTATYAFYGCSKLNNVTNAICDDVFPYGIFYYCYELPFFTINGSCYSINVNAFARCSKLNAINAKNVVRIETNVFQGCYKLANIKFSSSLSSIGAYAFYSCSSIQNINDTIKNIEYIGNSAFYGCTKLRQLSIIGNPIISSGAFGNCINLSKVYAPNLTALRGLPYVKDATFGHIVSIYEILSNSYLSSILDMSTVEYVANSAYLNRLKILCLENCSSFNVVGNIGDNNLEEIYLPKWSCNDSSFIYYDNTKSAYGFAGYTKPPTTDIRFYSNLKLSKLFLTCSTIMSSISGIFNMVNFPRFLSNSSITSSTIALYSCIEELGMYNFYHFTDRHEAQGPSYYSYMAYINYFSKLTSIHTNSFMVYDKGTYYDACNVKMSTVKDIFYDINNEYGIFSITRLSSDIFPSVINIHTNNISSFTFLLFDYVDFINLDNLNNIDNLFINMVNCENINTLKISKVKNITINCNYQFNNNRCFVSLPNLNTISFDDTEKIVKGLDMYANKRKGPFYEVDSLSNINMPKLKYLDDFYSGIFESCGHINELYLPELIGYSTDFSVSESYYRGFNCPYTTFDKVTLGISEIHSKNCYMFNTSELYLPKCSKIEMITGGYSQSLYHTHIGFDSNIETINAPNCDDFVINMGTVSEGRFAYYPINFHIKKVILSEYVNNFKFVGMPHLSIVSVKTSGSYNMSEAIFGACYSLKNIYMQANNDIILTHGPVMPDASLSSLYYSDVSSYYPNINTINITAGSMISISGDPFSPLTFSAQIRNMSLSADNIVLSNNLFVITDMLTIKANSVSISGMLVPSYSKFIGRTNGLIILDTPTFISTPFFSNIYYSSGYSLFNPIIKVRSSLISLYNENSEWQKYPNVKFIEI